MIVLAPAVVEVTTHDPVEVGADPDNTAVHDVVPSETLTNPVGATVATELVTLTSTV